MSTHELNQVAAVHLRPIDELRKRAGLAALTAVEVEREFADVNRSPVRRKAVTTRATSNTGAADALWSGIVAQLNASLPTSRTPIGAGRTSPSAGSVNPTQGDIDATWASIVTKLNQEAGLSDRRAR